ncbi:hypothetical protein [Cyanobium sp. NIES-981]|uniref:hypothetical protein n=1 Tax=Cyanobium sp. NIES-981 TaxID=1851505 RepID=UPI0007DCEEB6|nr:hypothetical protein [Cyanobium sp. NIES-981]SBO44642.1 conserved protein of unknown function [Cyanobium sp. NIES-981]
MERSGRWLLTAGLLTAAGLGGQPDLRAQEPSPSSLTGQTLQRIEQIKNEAMGLQRAVNLARGTAAKLNGGLSVYRPAVCMFQGINNNPCLVDRSAEGYTFRFLGGSPGWEQLQLPATVETELLISRDGRSVVQILYNGLPRPAAAKLPAQ